MDLGATLSLFQAGTSWADAMDTLMPEWMNVKPAKGALVTVHFPDEAQKERFNDIFLEAWGTFALSHKADGVDLIISYMKTGTWRKMVNAASMIQKKKLGETSIFSISDDQLRGYFIELFEEKYDGFKTKVYKGARGVGSELNEDAFVGALVEKMTATKGGRRSLRKRKTQRKSGRKTARKASRKTGRKPSRKTGRKASRKTARKASRKTYRKH